MKAKPYVPFPDSWEDVDLSAFEEPDEQLDLFGEKAPCNPSTEDA